MHYYIVDPPQGVPPAKITQRLHELLTPMGISGEISVATPARTSEELAYMGIDKGYTTIIAVGGEELANTVATILQNESREKVAFGIIPLNAGWFIPQLIGVANNDLRTGAEIIKQRHLDLIDIIQVGTKRYFFTEAIIAAPRQTKITLEIDQQYKAELVSDLIHISHDMVATTQAVQTKGLLHKTLSKMGLSEKNVQPKDSLFHGQQMRITAHEPLPVLVAGEVIAKTPTTFTKIPAALKLITTRAILPSKTISDMPLSFPKEPSTIVTNSDKETYSRTKNQ